LSYGPTAAKDTATGPNRAGESRARRPPGSDRFKQPLRRPAKIARLSLSRLHYLAWGLLAETESGPRQATISVCEEPRQRVGAPSRPSGLGHALFDEDTNLLGRLDAGVAVMDGAGIVVRWNEHAERLLGLKAADAVGHPWRELLEVVGGEEFAGSEVRRVAAEPSGWDGVTSLRVAGNPVRMRVHVQTIELGPVGDPPGVAASFWPAACDADKPAEGELPYRDLFRRSPEALLLTNLDGLVVEANDAATAMFGLTHEQLVGLQGRTLMEDWTVADAEAARSELESAGSIVRTVTIRVGPGGPGDEPGVLVAEAISTVASPTDGGYFMTRLRDLTGSRQRARMLRDLSALARIGEEPLGLAIVVRRAIDVVGQTWRADATLMAIFDGNSVGFHAGSDSPEPLRAALGELEAADSPLARRIRDTETPFAADLADEWPSEAAAGNPIGLETMWSAPLWFADRRIGAVLLFWATRPAGGLDSARLEQTGRFAGLAVGNAQFHQEIRRDAAHRAFVEGSARLGGVVMAQMPEGIVTVDSEAFVTAVNRAAEQIYGFSAAEAIGRPISEVIEVLQVDGTPFDMPALRMSQSTDNWQGRLIHRPLIGPRTGRHIVVDLSLTAMRGDDENDLGYIGMVRPVSNSSQLDSDAALLSSLALTLSRARSRQEVAYASLERLCEGTLADIGAVVTWTDPKRKTVEASRGLSEATVEALRFLSVPGRVGARREPGTILSFEQLPALLAGTPAEKLIERESITGGCVVDLRARDEIVGALILGSRRSAWTRPPDAAMLQAAAQIAGALENARYLDEERRLTSQLEAMMSLMLLPEGQISETVVAQLLLNRIIEALGADGGVVVRNESGLIGVVASHNFPNPMRLLIDGVPCDSLYFWRRLREPGTTAFHESLADMARTEPQVQKMAERGVGSHAVFPVRDGETLLGAFVCHFYSHTEPTPLLDERNLEAIGRIISIAYSNVRMSEGLAEAAEHERRLAAELRALQELTLLGASTDDLASLAKETIDMVVLASGASGGGYFLVDGPSGEIEQVQWVGQPSQRWPEDGDKAVPESWPALAKLQSGEGAWLSRVDRAPDDCDQTGCDYEAVLPLRVEEQLAGFLHLEWTGSPGEEEFDVHFLEPIARVCSISLANFRLRAELVHRAAEQQSLNHRLRTLDELTRIGEQASSFEELAHRTVSLVREVLGASGVCYLLMEPGHHFETHAVAGETGAFRLWLKGVPARDAPGGSLLLSGSSSVLEDFVAGQVNERVLPLARATGFASFGAIPIRTGEELAGSLLCFFEEPVARLPITEPALDSVARIAGIALANYRLRDSLSSSEERYRTLFAQTPDALFVTALDGTVLDANEAAVRTYRVNRGEMLGRYIGLLISADEREMARRRQIVWAQGRGMFRDRGRRHDGSEFPVELEIRVVELDGQRRFLHLIRDVSDQERLAGELLQAQKMEAIGSLVSGVAHELNNPLTGVIGFGGLLNSDPRLPEDMRNLAGLLVQEADRTKRIVQNLLDFARARQPERRPTPLGTLIQSVLDLQSYAIHANQIEVEVNIPESVPEIDLDRAQLQQVFLNLTINAIQAMRGSAHRKPPHLWITAELLQSPAGRGSKLDLGPHAQRVRITIRDDGPGVPDANRARLFVPFFTTKEPGEGTGLGLSVSFGIVAAHGGQLYYEPGPGGVGSCFIIEMPVKAAVTPDEQGLFSQVDAIAALTDGTAPTGTNGWVSMSGAGSRTAETTSEPAPAEPHAAEVTQPEPQEAAVDPPAPGGTEAATEPPSATSCVPEAARPHILVLDDEPSIRQLLQRALKAAGMECHPFQDGAQALDGVQEVSFDVMLIDHRMAGMTGTEFYEFAVNSRPELANRAIFMSGDVLNSDLAGFATERGIHILEKPFEMSQAVEAVRKTLAASARN
jgi:PAS domain S-box-containing protein